MKLQVRTSQWISRVLVAALMLAATPLPTLAGEPPAPAPPRPSLTVLVQQAAAVTPIAPARAQTATGAGKTAFGSPSFFKKPVGIVVLDPGRRGRLRPLFDPERPDHSPAKK